MQKIFALVVMTVFVLLLICSCSGSPSIKVKGQCLADEHCGNGYFCNDSYKCQKLPGFDGDEESFETDENGEASEDAESEL